MEEFKKFETKNKKNVKMKYSDLFLYLVMLYITCILVANIAAFKVIKLFSITVTAGTLVFPISYILGDVFSEIYGYKVTKKNNY